MTLQAATATMLDLANQWEAAIASAVLSGINGDQAHTYDPGKHLSRSDNIAKWGSSCWPVVHPKDKLGPSDRACAIDMNMSRADQNVVHNRLIALYNARGSDPRAAYIYAFNGWNGSGSPMRYNVANGATAVTDSSHTWHEHVETYYGYVNDPEMVRAIMSVITGQSVAAYNQGEIMAISDDDALKIARKVWGLDEIPAPASATDIATNPEWMPKSFLNDIGNRAREIKAMLLDATSPTGTQTDGGLPRVALFRKLAEIEAAVKAVLPAGAVVDLSKVSTSALLTEVARRTSDS